MYLIVYTLLALGVGAVGDHYLEAKVRSLVAKLQAKEKAAVEAAKKL